MKNMSTVTKEWVTVSEAAKMMDCSRRTVLRLAAAGKIRRCEVNNRLHLVRVADVLREKDNPNDFGRPRGS